MHILPFQNRLVSITMKTLTRPLALFVPSLLAFSLAACDRQADARKPTSQPAVPVIMKPASVQEVQRNIEVVGTLWADEDVIISNKINGKVIGIYKDVGDRAEPGEPLAELLEMIMSWIAIKRSQRFRKC